MPYATLTFMYKCHSSSAVTVELSDLATVSISNRHIYNLYSARTEEMKTAYQICMQKNIIILTKNSVVNKTDTTKEQRVVLLVNLLNIIVTITFDMNTINKNNLKPLDKHFNILNLQCAKCNSTIY